MKWTDFIKDDLTYHGEPLTVDLLAEMYAYGMLSDDDHLELLERVREASYA